MAKQKNYLFIHQNFPGQFVHVATELVRRGANVVALGIKGRAVPGVRYLRYTVPPLERTSEVPQLRDFEVATARGLACLKAMRALKDARFEPDVIVAHPGWGEMLFCKDVWPQARLVMFAEFFYGTEGSDYAFDAEFSSDTIEGRTRVRLKNTIHLHAMAAADVIYTPTEWQKSRLPAEYQGKVSVIFDGIDTERAKPNPAATVLLQRDNITLRPGHEVLTFVNRNLEPYRGFHIFMRALPAILAARPKARCLIVGRESVSYGSKPAGGGTWRQAMMKEVGERLPMDRVHFLGGLEYADYLRVLQVSACHVYMTYPFVLSWSCLEAMAAGCTVLASSTSPVKEVIQHGKTGRLFGFFDVAGLEREAIGILGDIERHRPLGVAARKWVVNRYDLSSVCLPRLLELLA